MSFRRILLTAHCHIVHVSIWSAIYIKCILKYLQVAEFGGLYFGSSEYDIGKVLG